jgi:hypothetical protein
MGTARTKASACLRRVAAYKAANRQAAAIILANPSLYPGLPQLWAELLNGEMTMAMLFTEGMYMAKVVDQYLTESKKGTPAFVLRFRLLCNLDEPETPLEKYQRDLIWWLTPKMVEWLKRDLASLGYSGPDLNGIDPDVPGFHSFRDQEIAVRLKYEKSEDGELKERWYLGNGTRKLKDKSKVEYINELMRCKKGGGNGGGAAGGGDPSEDDVLF